METDFTNADMTNSDMRSSPFKRVVLVNTNSDGADFRRSYFVDCDFEGATMKGVTLTREQASTMRLSETQRNEIDWRSDGGPEPDGG